MGELETFGVINVQYAEPQSSNLVLPAMITFCF